MPELSLNNVYLFILLIFPGFITQSIYDLFVPAKERPASLEFFRALSWGTLNLALTWPLVRWSVLNLASQDVSPCTWWASYIVFFLALAAFPAVMGIAAYRIRRSRWVIRWLLSPTPTAWDYFFQLKATCWAIFTLKDGTKVGGYYGPESCASSFPSDPEVYVSDVWRPQGR